MQTAAMCAALKALLQEMRCVVTGEIVIEWGQRAGTMHCLRGGGGGGGRRAIAVASAMGVAWRRQPITVWPITAGSIVIAVLEARRTTRATTLPSATTVVRHGTVPRPIRRPLWPAGYSRRQLSRPSVKIENDCSELNVHPEQFCFLVESSS